MESTAFTLRNNHSNFTANYTLPSFIYELTDGSVMAIVIVQMDPMNGIALLPPAVRINSDVTTANVFRVICSAVVRLNAMTRPTKRLAMVLENPFLFVCILLEFNYE